MAEVSDSELGWVNEGEVLSVDEEAFVGICLTRVMSD